MSSANFGRLVSPLSISKTKKTTLNLPNILTVIVICIAIYTTMVTVKNIFLALIVMMKILVIMLVRAVLIAIVSLGLAEISSKILLDST